MLECGHRGVLPSSWWRLTDALVGCLVGTAVRRGVWCSKCQPPALCAVTETLGTCRLEGAATKGK